MGAEKKNFYDVIAKTHHSIMKEKGFWSTDTTLPEKLMLVITEISEAAEEVRTGSPDLYFIDAQGRKAVPAEISLGSFRLNNDGEEKLCKPEGVIVELADVALRLFDMMAHLGISPDHLANTNEDLILLDLLCSTCYMTRPLEAYRLFSYVAGGHQPYAAIVNTWCLLHLYLANTGKLDMFNEVLTVKMLYNKERERMHGKLM